MDNSNLIKLSNPTFSIIFAEKEYQIRKATLADVAKYLIKIDEISKENLISSVRDIRLISYCLYILLKKVDNEITEDFVYENCPGDIDGLDFLTMLGFINPEKIKMVKQTQKEVVEKLITKDSL